MATPALVQHKGGGSLDNRVGANNAKYFLPNPTLAGNLILVFASWNNGDSTLSSITDDGGNTWSTTPAGSVVSATGVKTAIFHLPNCNANTKSVTINFAGNVGNLGMKAAEFANIALSSPLNGTVAAADVACPSLACGSFTPTTNNDSAGGNLIVAYFRCSKVSGNSSGADHFAAGGSFILLDGDANNDPVPGTFQQHTCQYFVQSTQAAINPAVTASGESASDTYNCVAIALKAASAGTQYNASNGIYRRKVLHYTKTFPATGSVKFTAPSQGNLRVLQVSITDGVVIITSVTDSDGNTYTPVTNTNAHTYLFFAPNCTRNDALTFTINSSGGTQVETSVRFFDIENAASSPLGAHNDGTFNVTATLRADDLPTLTPTAVGSMIIACGPTTGGPVLQNFDPSAPTLTPAAAIFDLIHYTGEVDNDTWDNADACAAYKNPDLTTIHWNWVIGVNGANISVVSAEFKTAPISVNNPTSSVIGLVESVW